MFLEVYAIPLNDYSKEAAISVKPENKRLIETTGIRIRYATYYTDRAEIGLPNTEILVAVGSYDELVERSANTEGPIARIFRRVPAGEFSVSQPDSACRFRH